MSAALDHLAARVAADPAFIASRLARLAVTHGYGDADLCRVLACSPDVLTRLRLCRVPGPGEDEAVYVVGLRGRWEFDAAALLALLS